MHEVCVHICTARVHLYNICVVSDGLFLDMHFMHLLYLMECFKYAFSILVVFDVIYP